MICEKCKEDVPQDEICDYKGKLICEDCYIEAAYSPKTCDVAAVHSAKVHREMTGQTGTEGLTNLQKEIYNYIKSEGQAEKIGLHKKFNISPKELEKQFAILRHCELLKGKKEGNKIYLVPFDS